MSNVAQNRRETLKKKGQLMRDHKQALSHRDGAAGAEQLDGDQLGDDDDDDDDEDDE